MGERRDSKDRHPIPQNLLLPSHAISQPNVERHPSKDAAAAGQSYVPRSVTTTFMWFTEGIDDNEGKRTRGMLFGLQISYWHSAGVVLPSSAVAFECRGRSNQSNDSAWKRLAEIGLGPPRQ